MYRDLTHFIGELERADELLRITVPVDPIYEITEITDRVSKSPGGGKALLFENTGTPFPVLTNMFGSDCRMAMALGVEDLPELTARLRSLFSAVLSPKEGIGDKLRMLPLLGDVAQWMPGKVSSRGKCQQVVLTGEDADLGLLPVLKCWPEDGGRFVTLPLVNTLDPESGSRNVGMYRMQVTGPRTTGMHWHMHKTGERHYRAYHRKNLRMPISVCLGGDPAYTYAATAPMPDNMDEYLLAGFLRKKSVRLVKCITNDMWVPEDCDFVIEGYVDTAQAKFVEGPFGDHTGFYSLEDLYPEFHVTAITHRRDAVYPATIVGIPPQEDAYIAKATETIFLEPMRLALQPEIEDLYMPQAGVAHNLALVSIRNEYPAHGLKTASSMWGAGQMMFNKALMVLPSYTDLRDTNAVAHLVRNADPQKDVFTSRGVYDVLDHSTATTGMGGKIALDLTETAKRLAEQVTTVLGAPPLADMCHPTSIPYPEWAEGIDLRFIEKWGVVVVWCDAHADVDADTLLRYYMDVMATSAGGNVAQSAPFRYAVLADKTAEELSGGELLWLFCGNTEPSRDIVIESGLMAIDARTKFPRRKGYPSRWPNPVTSSPETISLVDKRWREYFPDAPCPGIPTSPSLRYRGLCIGNGAAVTENGSGKE